MEYIYKKMRYETDRDSKIRTSVLERKKVKQEPNNLTNHSTCTERQNFSGQTYVSCKKNECPYNS